MTNIVIVGGGFAGTALAKTLEKRAPENVSVTLINETNYTTFNPMLAEVVGYSVFPVQVLAPIRQMLKHGRFIMGAVTAIDLREKKVRYDCEGDDRELAYDQLVLAFGTRANMAFIPGMEEHAVPLKMIGDALKIRNQVLERLEQAEQEPDPDRRRWLTHFIVVGGGFSGVEVAGEITDYIHANAHYYRNIRAEDLRVTLLHDQERLLTELPNPLGMHAGKCMGKRCVNILLHTRVSSADAHGVEAKNLQTGETVRIDAGTIVCTIGAKPNMLAEALDLPKERGRFLTNADLSVPGHPGIWAVGDCALIKNARDGQFAPPTAQFAVQEARQLADNLLRRLRGEESIPFTYKSKGMLATIGRHNGVASLYGINLSGFTAWLIWRAFYLSQMPTFARKLRIFVEWSWGMLFANEITHRRFAQTDDATQKRLKSQLNP